MNIAEQLKTRLHSVLTIDIADGKQCKLCILQLPHLTKFGIVVYHIEDEDSKTCCNVQTDDGKFHSPCACCLPEMLAQVEGATWSKLREICNQNGIETLFLDNATIYRESRKYAERLPALQIHDVKAFWGILRCSNSYTDAMIAASSVRVVGSAYYQAVELAKLVIEYK